MTYHAKEDTERVFSTGDKCMSHGVRHPQDEELMNCMADRDDGEHEHYAVMEGEGIIALTAENLVSVIERAKSAAERYKKLASELLDDTTSLGLQRAAFVRRLRVKQKYTWRALAQRCYEEWGLTPNDVDPSWHQGFGLMLCELAARMFGEHYHDDNWNPSA